MAARTKSQLVGVEGELEDSMEEVMGEATISPYCISERFERSLIILDYTLWESLKISLLKQITIFK